MTSKPILVLGAYGEAGEAIVRGLRARGLPVTASGRRLQALQKLGSTYPGTQTLQLDVRDVGALEKAVRASGLVINCVGPYIGTGLKIAQVAVSQGRSVIDLASEQEHHRRLQILASDCANRGVTVLTGAGAYPGISGLLLKALLAEHPEASAAELALITGPPSESGRGGAQMLSGLAELAHEFSVLREGKLVRVPPGRWEKFSFPQPFGERSVLAWPQLEILDAAARATIPTLSTYAALGGHTLPPAFLLGAAGWLRPTPGSWAYALLKRALPILQRPPPGDSPTTNNGAILVRVFEGASRYETAVLATDLPAATAWLPVFAAAQWASGTWERGLITTPMSFFEPATIVEAIRTLDHLIVSCWNAEAVDPDRDRHPETHDQNRKIQ